MHKDSNYKSARTTLTKAEIDCLLSARVPLAPQDKLAHFFMLFLLHTGVRTNEAILLKIKDIDWPNQCVRIRSNGTKPFSFILNPSALDLLRVICNKKMPEELVFSYDGKPLTKRGINSSFARLVNDFKSINTERININAIRRSVVSNYLCKGSAPTGKPVAKGVEKINPL